MTQTIETITNNLADGYNELEQGTFQEASEVQILRRTDKPLRRRGVYTANLPVFRDNNGTLEYSLGGKQAFEVIAGADIKKFTSQIRNNEVYELTPEQEAQLGGLGIIWVGADGLGLQEYRNNKEWSYFTINTSDTKAKKVDPSQRVFATKAHGSLASKYDPKQEHSDYGETMNMLNNAGIPETKIWVPTQSHILPYVKGGKTVARASGLGSFVLSSFFNAGLRDVGIHDGLCGVPKVGEADDVKISEELQQVQQALNLGNAFRYSGKLYVPVDSNAEMP